MDPPGKEDPQIANKHVERVLNGICVREMKENPSVPTSMAITETWKVRVGENVLLLPPVHRRRNTRWETLQRLLQKSTQNCHVPSSSAPP